MHSQARKIHENLDVIQAIAQLQADNACLSYRLHSRPYERNMKSWTSIEVWHLTHDGTQKRNVNYQYMLPYEVSTVTAAAPMLTAVDAPGRDTSDNFRHG
jgi:hypothetical protein